MAIKTLILPSTYQDSVLLMRVAGQVKTRPGVREVAALMGTPSNQALLKSAGLATKETETARPEDLILAVDAEKETVAEAALASAQELLTAHRQAAGESGEFRPRTFDSALRFLPDANLVTISVPGAYAKFEAMRALRNDLHVFLFSDNVSLEDEVELKQLALERGLLCMGPDCGTAYLNGTGIGFYNVVSRGRVGCVAASGTGLQAAASRLAMLGEGISHGIGVGGRDLSAAVGGAMSLFALEALAADSTTEAVILISKPPDAEVMHRLAQVLEKTGKPTVACCLGASGPKEDIVVWTDTVDDAAQAAVALLKGGTWSPQNFSDPGAVRHLLHRMQHRGKPAESGLLGLYVGGTLAHEAHLVLEPLLGAVASQEDGSVQDLMHRIIDLGDDAYTVGRPHPMIDPEIRSEQILKGARQSEVGVLLFDLVLGKGSHSNPAAPLVAALEEGFSAARAEGRELAAVASVIGTPGDPQGFANQVKQLEKAGVAVFPSNAEAARFAALLVRPDLSPALLGE